MSNFAYTSGNPNNLVGGNSASMADIQGPFVDLRMFINGSLDETNVPNLDAAFSTYKPLFRAMASVTAAASATYIITPNNQALASGAAGSALAVWRYNPTSYNANTRTTKLQLRLTLLSNAVASGSQFTLHLLPVAGTTGASGVSTGVTVGATVASAGPLSVTSGTTASTDGNDTSVAANLYMLAVSVSPSMAAGSNVQIIGDIFMRQV